MSKIILSYYLFYLKKLWIQKIVFTFSSDDVCDLLKEYLDRLNFENNLFVEYLYIIESYHNFTKLDPKSVFRMNRGSKQSYHELLKENKCYCHNVCINSKITYLH